MKKILAIVLVCGLALTLIGAVAPITDGKFDSGAVAVTDASSYVEVARIRADGRGILLQVTVGSGGAIAHLKISQAVIEDGAVNTLAEDTDFATATVAMPYVLGSTIHQTAANGTFQVRLESGASDYVISVKKATGNTTVRVVGRVL